MPGANTPDRPNSALAMRNYGVILLSVVLAGCGSGSSDLSGRHVITISQDALHSRIAALTECPSPLNRLGIGRITLRLFVGADGDIDFVIPSAEDAEGSAVRFDLGSDERKDGVLTVSWAIDLSGTARELDLGEDRLLNPAKLSKELNEAVDRYLGFYAHSRDGAGDSANKRELKAACQSFGRVVDAIAVTTNPNLRRTIEQQKSRDALGWLFKDNYKLRTASASNGGWDDGGDY